MVSVVWSFGDCRDDRRAWRLHCRRSLQRFVNGCCVVGLVQPPDPHNRPGLPIPLAPNHPSSATDLRDTPWNGKSASR